MSAYRWDVTVRRWDHYGQKVESKIPMTVVASTRSEVTDKVRAAFEANYDSFRKFWSHDWTLGSVTEVETITTPPLAGDTTDEES